MLDDLKKAERLDTQEDENMEDFLMEDEEAKEHRNISNAHQPGIGAVSRRNPKPRVVQSHRTSHPQRLEERNEEFFDCIDDALSGRR